MGTQADRAVYEGRVNAVIDYIEAHLGEELTVEGLAEVAHFSPFHFHRIFSAMTGETLGTFIGRVRLERAAQLLVAQPRRPVTEMALDSGFANPSSFSRAFREAFGTSPTEWRRGGHRQHERQSRDPATDPTPEDLATRGRFGITGARLSVETGRTVWEVAAGSLGSVRSRRRRRSPGRWAEAGSWCRTSVPPVCGFVESILEAPAMPLYPRLALDCAHLAEPGAPRVPTRRADRPFVPSWNVR